MCRRRQYIIPREKRSTLLYLKKHNTSIVAVIIIYTFLLVFVTSCDSVKEKEHLRTDKISNELYVEHYIMEKGGVFVGNTYVCYLTDSSKYYKKIDVYYDDEDVIYSVQGPIVVISIKPDRCYGFEDIFRERHYKYKFSNTR